MNKLSIIISKHKSLFLLIFILFTFCNNEIEQRLQIIGYLDVWQYNGAIYYGSLLTIEDHNSPESTIAYLNGQCLIEDTNLSGCGWRYFIIPDDPVPGRGYNLEYITGLGQGKVYCRVPGPFTILSPDSVPRNSTVYLRFSPSDFASYYRIYVNGPAADTEFTVLDTSTITIGPEFTANPGFISFNVDAYYDPPKEIEEDDPDIIWYGNYCFTSDFQIR